MAKRNVTVADLKDKFQFTQVVGDERSLTRPIEVAEISRPGFELAGFFQHSDLRRVIVFGEKEIAFIEHLDKKVQEERFDGLTQSETPAIIVCRGLECPAVLKRIAKKKNFPIFISNQATGRTSIEITSYLDEQLAEEALLHGVFLSIHGKGVIIKGDSGIGKSEIALDLI